METIKTKREWLLRMSSMVKKGKKRIAWIDIARGIAIIAVIAGHSLGNYWPGYLGNFLFAFHMPIFFVLSGYLYHVQSQKVLTKKNFFNLLVPYLATVAIELVLLTFYRGFPNSIIAPSRGDSYKQFLLSALYAAGGTVNIPHTRIVIQPIGAIWFLVAMFIANQIFNLLMRAKIKLQFKAIIVIILTLVGIFSANLLFLPFSIQPALIAQFFLFTGYLLKRFQLLDKVNWLVLLVFAIIWLWDSSFNLFAFEGVTAQNIYLAVIVGALASIVVIKLSIYLDELTDKFNWHHLQRVLLFWGSQSLILLCFHLVDLDYVQLWPQVINLFKGTNYLFAVVMGVIYRVLFVSVIAIAMPRIVFLRSCFMHRKYPFKGQKEKKD